MKLGVIRVVTTNDPDFLNAHGKVLAEELDIEVISKCLPTQPDGVHDQETFQAASRKTVELAQHMADHDGVDAILVSCAADPGVTEAAALLEIPVIGAGSAAARLARERGTRVGVLDLTPETPVSVRSVLGDAFLGARAPAGITRTTDLQRPGAVDTCIDAAHELVPGGAEVIMFACTGMTTMNLITSLDKAVNVPLVDAVRAGGQAARRAVTDQSSI